MTTPDIFAAANEAARLEAEQCAAVFELRCACWKNGYRPLAVYTPGAIINGELVKNAGKRPVAKDWLRLAMMEPPWVVGAPNRVSTDALNTGLLTGAMSGLDIDVMIQDVVDRIVDRIEQTLGPTPLSRIGNAPKILLCYRAVEPFKKFSTPNYTMPDGSKAQLEIMGSGQQVVAFGIHPDTRQPYTWLNGSPENTPLAELPEIKAVQARDLIGEAAAILEAAGGVVVKPDKSEKPDKPTTPPPGQGANGDGFFRNVNNAALAKIAAWVQALHPDFRDCGNSGWRLSSKDLGRDLQEDIAVHPDGIQDFGEEVPLTAIDLVMKLEAARNPTDAAFWLCEKLDVTPEALGWHDGTTNQDADGRPGGTTNQGGDRWEIDSEKKIIANSQHNIRLALQKLGASLIYDQFADRSLVAIEHLGWSRLDLGDPLMHRMWLTIDERFHFRPTLDFFAIVLRDAARQNAFHPVLQYIDEVKLKHDKGKRLDDWLFTYGRAPKRDEKYNEYVRKVGRIMLIAAIRRLRQPGCKFDEVMVLVNEKQGTDKSEALSRLAVREEWFTDSIDLGASDKLAIEQLQGIWIVEFPEMRGRRKNDVDRVKAFLSKKIDRARLAYDRFRTNARRQCVYFGSTNDIKFLRDRTGNRRFWPILGVHFDIPELVKNVDQLWAEAAIVEEAGESIRLPPELWAVAETVQNESLEEDPWVEVLNTALEDLDGKIRAGNVWVILDIDVARRTPDADNRMGTAMRELGWTRKQRRYGGEREWSYIKGEGEEQVFASRDLEFGTLRISQGLKTWTIGRGETFRKKL
jgi:hypothetical protein